MYLWIWNIIMYVCACVVTLCINVIAFVCTFLLLFVCKTTCQDDRSRHIVAERRTTAAFSKLEYYSLVVYGMHNCKKHDVSASDYYYISYINLTNIEEYYCHNPGCLTNGLEFWCAAASASGPQVL